MSDHTSCRVVLCDDTPEIRLILRTLLRIETDMEVVAEAANGLEAVHLAERHQPDVVVLDLSMPVMDGFTAIPEIAKVSPDTSIVMYSAHGSPDVEAKAMRLGAHHFVRKGGDPMDVIASVEEECAAG